MLCVRAPACGYERILVWPTELADVHNLVRDEKGDRYVNKYIYKEKNTHVGVFVNIVHTYLCFWYYSIFAPDIYPTLTKPNVAGEEKIIFAG